MSASVGFADYKAKLADAMKSGFNREQIATVFLGGTSRVDSVIALTDEQFEDAIDALAMLLIDCVHRVLDDAFVYNAVKHGVSAIALDNEAKISFTSEDGERIPMHEGPTHVYLHKKGHRDATNAVPHWWLTIEDANPGREIAVTTLITKALDSMWDVARRRYLGRSGHINYFSKAAVELAVWGTTMQAANHLKRGTHELIKVKPDGSVDGTDHRITTYLIPRTWSLQAAMEAARMFIVELPTRQRDQQLYSAGRTAYLPITPRGFERG